MTASDDRRLRLRRGAHAVRPVRRRAGRRPPRRPRPPSCCSGLLARTPGLDPAARRRGGPRQRQRRRRGQPQRRRMAVAARRAAGRRCPATTVNRLCGSSLDAAMIGSRTIETGDADVVLTGGVESMTRAPWVLPKPDAAVPGRQRRPPCRRRSAGAWSTRRCRRSGRSRWARPTSSCSEQLRHLARAPGRVRGALAPARRTRPGTDGFYDDLVVAVPGHGPRRGTRASGPARTAETLAGAEAVVPPGRHDHRRQRLAAQRRRLGGAARVRGRGRRARRDPVARIAGRGAHRPGAAALRLRARRGGRTRRCARAGIGWDDVGAVELNEAFAVQSLACIDAWKIDPEIVNTRGGAIAIGHPLGASGGRILGTLAKRAARGRASAGASRRSASASARDSPWCSRT